MPIPLLCLDGRWAFLIDGDIFVEYDKESSSGQVLRRPTEDEWNEMVLWLLKLVKDHARELQRRKK